ncbi:uncharacterized protein CTHT_0038320 [Thermochaetoides thermophila DSM 1495]|uniref:Uncharacterized protein n=1 Tax=Chaetomium thermophilum (strain DSM 1495 / CBS 144.50 / IMI 039719) TaxID=759272 RepID=G0S8J6_CHATD|nr:hypothetical protein CTHT_0038320 [Thermochaetoides thermophila DSM 1495]EGS21956.1 hypothetical protein CTHT_0038320 [Thermochaetoides thermophila DSM 1495]
MCLFTQVIFSCGHAAADKRTGWCHRMWSKNRDHHSSNGSLFYLCPDVVWAQPAVPKPKRLRCDACHDAWKQSVDAWWASSWERIVVDWEGLADRQVVDKRKEVADAKRWYVLHVMIELTAASPPDEPVSVDVYRDFQRWMEGEIEFSNEKIGDMLVEEQQREQEQAMVLDLEEPFALGAVVPPS